MGLDVYLMYNDPHGADRDESRFEMRMREIVESIGKPTSKMTPTEQLRFTYQVKVLEAEAVSESWNRHVSPRPIELPSAKYPEHMFRIGYFRSSYNNGGIDQVLRRVRLHGLQWIFDVGQQVDVIPNWPHALERVNEIIERYSAHLVFLYHQKGATDWYLQALEIVRETIEYVLAQSDTQNYSLRWSG